MATATILPKTDTTENLLLAESQGKIYHKDMLIVEITNSGEYNMKVGDGVHGWSSLKYLYKQSDFVEANRLLSTITAQANDIKSYSTNPPKIADTPSRNWLIWNGTAYVDSGKSSVGYTPKFSIGTVNTVSAGTAASASISGTSDSPQLNLSIPIGNDGANGKTPVRGTDYWTTDDINTIKSYCENAIKTGEW